MANEALKKVGAQLVVEGLETSLQAFAQLQSALDELNGESGFKLSARLAKEFGLGASEATRVVKELADGAQTSFDVYARSLLETSIREKQFAEESTKTFTELSQKQQQAIITMAQQVDKFIWSLDRADEAWAEIVSRSNRAVTPTEQQNVVNLAQQAREESEQYVQFWEKAYADKEGFATSSSRAIEAIEQEMVVIEARLAREYVDFWEKANLDVVASREAANKSSINPKAGTLFSDPAREEEMRKVQADNARIAAAAIAEAQRIVNEETAKGSAISKTYTEQLLAQGLSAKEVAQVLKELGIVENQLGDAEIKDAEAAKIVEATHRRVTQAYADQEKQIKLLTNETNTSAVAHEGVGRSAIQSSRAFFALTLASFGLMSITQELKKSFGDELPDAFEKTSAAVQQIASFGSAGAFIGGGPGAIIGGITGAIIAMTTAAVTADPAVQQLNQSLNNMSKQDETIETMAKIAGVTKEVATEWDEAAKKSPEFAKQLENILRKAEPIPPVLTAIRTVSHELLGDFSALERALGDAGDAANKLILFLLGSSTALIKFAEDLVQGKSVIEAYKDAQTSMYNVLVAVDKATGEAGVSIGDANALTEEAARINAEAAKEAEKLADAERNLAKAFADADFRLAQLAERTANQYAQAQQQYTNAVQDAAEARQNAVFNAEQNLTDRIADLWQSLQDKIVDLNQTLADRVSDIQVQLGNRIADIETQLQDRLADIAQDLADKISDINQDLQNKLAELAHQREQKVDESNRKIQEAAQDLARKLFEIERERIEATEALAFNTAEQLRGARTEHDREAILRRAQFEKGQIDQRANDARNDAQNEYENKVKQAELEKKLAQEEYEYEVMLAKRLAEQKRREAEREAREQEQRARRAAEEQIAQAQRQAAQQIEIAKREFAEQLRAAERRYEEEKAQAVRTYNEQVEAARRAEQAKLSDAARALNERNTAIAQSAELERQQIEKTKQDAINAYKQVISEIKNLKLEIAGILALVLELAKMPAFLAVLAAGATANLFEDWIKGFEKLGLGLTPKVGGYGGLDMTVPEGHDKDTFMIGARSGEHVVITPPGVNNNTSSKNLTINIFDATDPRKVGEAVRRELTNASWR